MPQYKISFLSIVYLIFFIADWFISNTPLLKARTIGVFTEKDLLINIHDSINGYAGLQQLLVIYSLLLLFGVYFVCGKEELHCLLRYKTRSDYKRIQVIKAILVAGIFAVLHELVNFVCVNIYFEKDFLTQNNFLSYSLVTTILLFGFYIQVGLIYFIVADLIHNKLLTILISFLINLGQFWICKFQLIGDWIPRRDLMITCEYLDNKLLLNELLMPIIKMYIIVFILYLISQILFGKKDILSYEK